MPNLLVEIGNTALKASYAEGLTLGKTFRYQGERMIEYILILSEDTRPELLVVSSVRTINSDEEKQLRSCCSKLILLDSKHTDVLRAYSLPEYLTYDRAAALLAVRRMFAGKQCTVFDLGTTISVDFLSAEGEYLGGNVSPGCRTRFKSLNRYSRSLPLVNTPEQMAPRGNGIQSSIEAGVVSGIVFEIEGYIRETPDNVVVFTGGDAEYFAKRMESPIFVISNLVPMGLSSIAQDYDDRK
ncbi:MAG: type III pantothenate kinase [Bacteroidales bacterium]|nr:type III pantothenate kinase [Candidatus Cryptobacteroides aphodequi]